VALATLVLGARPGAAQLPIPPSPTGRGQDSAQAADTVKVPPFRIAPPISPLGAFGRSFLIPGWGQAALGRRVTGAYFVFWEGVTLAMTIKAVHQLSYLEAVGDSARVESKKQEIQDWAVLLVFNHLVAGAEAFVSAYLWDFPVELEVRALPGGAIGLGARLPSGVSRRPRGRVRRRSARRSDAPASRDPD
jgi:hypothetical protein